MNGLHSANVKLVSERLCSMQLLFAGLYTLYILMYERRKMFGCNCTPNNFLIGQKAFVFRGDSMGTLN